jgi:hypothetical protein
MALNPQSLTTGIYRIYNKVTNKSYIGQTINLKKRLIDHRYLLKSNKHINTYLQNSFNKYGLKNFEFNILEYCNKEDLDEKEIYYIDKFNSLEDGYNLIDGGSNKSYLTLQKKCYLYNIKTKDIINFDSVSSCARYLKRHHSTVLKAIEKNYIVNEKFIIGFDKEVLKISKKKRRSNYKDKKIKVYKNDNFYGEYIDIYEFAKELNLTKSNIQSLYRLLRKERNYWYKFSLELI